MAWTSNRSLRPADLIVVTNNSDAFSRVVGLRVEDREIA